MCLGLSTVVLDFLQLESPLFLQSFGCPEAPLSANNVARMGSLVSAADSASLGFPPFLRCSAQLEAPLTLFRVSRCDSSAMPSDFSQLDISPLPKALACLDLAMLILTLTNPDSSLLLHSLAQTGPLISATNPVSIGSSLFARSFVCLESSMLVIDHFHRGSSLFLLGPACCGFALLIFDFSHAGLAPLLRSFACLDTPTPVFGKQNPEVFLSALDPATFGAFPSAHALARLDFLLLVLNFGSADTLLLIHSFAQSKSSALCWGAMRLGVMPTILDLTTPGFSLSMHFSACWGSFLLTWNRVSLGLPSLAPDPDQVDLILPPRSSSHAAFTASPFGCASLELLGS